MNKLIVFNQVSLDGYFADANSDMSWAHKQDAEWNAFVAENAKGDAVLLFGRITYEQMAGFWPSSTAIAAFSHRRQRDEPPAEGGLLQNTWTKRRGTTPRW